MAYLDDFGGTPDVEVRVLKQTCEVNTCQHPRYQHGDARLVRNGWARLVVYEAGKCCLCKCETFAAEPLITEDEVLDLAMALRYDVHLGDIGIVPLSKEKCAQLTIRHTGAGQLVAACSLEANHPGDHAPDWNDLHSVI